MKENFHHRLFVLKKYENCLFICNYTCILLLLKVFFQGNEYEMPQGHKMPQGYEMPQGYMEGMCFRKKKENNESARSCIFFLIPHATYFK